MMDRSRWLTPKFLELLEKYKIKATFFVIGNRAEKNPDLIKKIYNSGHELGNHTWSHSTMVGRSSSFVRGQIKKTDELLRKLGYKGVIHFRSPKGMKFVTLPRVLAQQKRKNILFDVAAWDWSCPGKSKIVSNAMSQVRRGSIILLHDGCGDQQQTLEATEIIIKKLIKKGYKFATISELLACKK